MTKTIWSILAQSERVVSKITLIVLGSEDAWIVGESVQLEPYKASMPYGLGRLK